MDTATTGYEWSRVVAGVCLVRLLYELARTAAADRRTSCVFGCVLRGRWSWSGLGVVAPRRRAHVGKYVQSARPPPIRGAYAK